MIVHVDMDAFYASVEIRDNPALAGKAVAVGGSADSRGVISAASYEARRYGVHSAMPTSVAQRLCPDLVLVRGNMEKYAAISQQLHDMFHQVTPLVEPLALDEAFLDVTGSIRLFGPASEIGRQLKQEIRSELGLTASVGVAPNKFLAKVASDIMKPDGFVVVEPGHETEFLDPLPVSRLWGVGKATQERMNKFSLRTIRQVRQSDPGWLEREFGKSGRALWLLAKGMDKREVVSERKAKSISHETTFARDIDQTGSLLAVLSQLTEAVCFRLRHKGIRGKTVNLKIRFGDFSTFTRSRSLSRATDSTQQIWETVKQLFAEFYQVNPRPVRLIGMGVSGFGDPDHPQTVQSELFVPEADESNVDQVSDEINLKYGAGAISRGRGRTRKHFRNSARPGDSAQNRTNNDEG